MCFALSLVKNHHRYRSIMRGAAPIFNTTQEKGSVMMRYHHPGLRAVTKEENAGGGRRCFFPSTNPVSCSQSIISSPG